MKFDYPAARAASSKDLDTVERLYIDYVADLKERHEILGGPAPEDAQTSERELRARFPALDGNPTHLAHKLSQQFTSPPIPDHTPPAFSDGSTDSEADR